SDTETSAVGRSGNAISGDYAQTDSATTTASQTQTMTSTAGAALVQTVTPNDPGTHSLTGHPRLGTLHQNTIRHNSATTHQPSPKPGGSSTVHDSTTGQTTATEYGNSITGTYSGSSTYTDTDALTQIGQDAAGSFSYSSQSTDVGSTTDNGNIFRG